MGKKDERGDGEEGSPVGGSVAAGELLEAVREIVRETMPIRSEDARRRQEERAAADRFHARWQYGIVAGVLIGLAGLMWLFREDPEMSRLLLFAALAFLGGTGIAPSIQARRG